MFTKPETQNIVSRLILSEATFGIFGLVLLVVMLCFAFAGTASDSNRPLNAKAKPNKPAETGLVARNRTSFR